MPKEKTKKERKGKFHCVLPLSYRVHLQWGSKKRISLKCLWETLKCSSVVQLPKWTEGQFNCLSWAAVVQTQRCSLFFLENKCGFETFMRKLRFKCVGKMILMMMHPGLTKSSTTFCPEPEIIRVSHATHWVMPFLSINYWYYVQKSHCFKPGFVLQ